MPPATPSFHGHCALMFTPVAETFGRLLRETEAAGMAVCVYHQGEMVVDLWGGTRDRDNRLPWERDTLVNVFSATKAFTAAAVLLLADRGEIDIDKPVAHYWPAFARNGKADIRIRQVLNHTAGLAAFSDPVPDDDLYDWARMTAHVEAMSPNWTPSEQQGYHPFTFGWILGELIRRVTGEMPGDFLRDTLCEPLGLDFHIGLSRADLARAADVRPMTGGATDRPPLSSLAALAFSNPASLGRGSNSTAWRTCQVPAANGHGTAAALARLYNVLISGKWRGETLFSPRALSWCREPTTAAFDVIHGAPQPYSLGFFVNAGENGAALVGRGHGSFGHPGAGGSLGFADPEYGIAFGFVTRNLSADLLGDRRAQRLSDCIYDCLG